MRIADFYIGKPLIIAENPAMKREVRAAETADSRRDRDQFVEPCGRMIVDLAMRLANVCAILVKIGAGLTLADRAKILGAANIGVDEVIGVEDDILPVDLVEAYAQALPHTKIGERHVVALQIGRAHV